MEELDSLWEPKHFEREEGMKGKANDMASFVNRNLEPRVSMPVPIAGRFRWSSTGPSV